MLKSILLVGAGGFAGSVCRYLISRLMANQWGTVFPFGTFTVNIAGCLIIGLIYGLGLVELTSSQMRLLLATGFCGGFTTFSSFSLEFLILLREGHTTMAFLYAGGSVVAGLLAVGLGLLAARSF